MRNKAQSTLEYFVMIAVIVAALFAMQVYIKRGIQGKMRDSADSIGQGFLYSPGATVSNSNITTISREITSSYSKDNPTDSNLKLNISESTVQNTRTTERNEDVLSYAAEPQRQ